MIVRDLGQIGAVPELRLNSAGKLLFTVYRNEAVWDLSGYTTPTYALKVRSIPVGATVAPGGTVTAVTAASGAMAYAPGASDPIAAASGVYEARLWVTAGGKTHASDLFRFSIGEGPA